MKIENTCDLLQNTAEKSGLTVDDHESNLMKAAAKEFPMSGLL